METSPGGSGVAPPAGGVDAIEIRDVEKVYAPGTSRATRALRAVSLGIRDNEFFTLLGPSGCGKTTLLRLIAGFESATGGSIRLFGARLDGLPPQRRPVNTVFQHYALFPHLTVVENVAFGLEMLGKARPEIERAVADSLSLVRMSDFAGRRPAELSGGQQQRVALARALAPRPRVLLLDEPLSALDLKLRQAMRLELKDLQDKTGITFVFVTHDQDEALAMSDRLAVMAAGEIQQVGTPAEIYREPANRFVAEFIGETNLVPARVDRVEGGVARCVMAEGAFSVEAATDTTTGTAAGEQVTLSVRPEQIRLAARGAVAPAGEIGGRVRDRIFLGTDTVYHVAIGAGLVLTVRVPNRHDDDPGVPVGGGVGLEIAPRAARVLAG